MRIIGINGFKHAGKDTTFSFIAEVAASRKERAVRLAFADKLKVMAAKALGFEEEDTAAFVHHMDDIKESGTIKVSWDWLSDLDEEPLQSTHEISGRSYLQLFGEKAREVFGDTFWIDQVVPNPEAYDGAEDAALDELGDREGWPDFACITDVRYPNEARRVLELGGIVVEVVRPGLESDGHSSEVALPRELVTVTLNNDSSLDDLKGKVRTLIEGLNG